MKKLSIILAIFLMFLISSCSKKQNNFEQITFSTWGSNSEISTVKTLIQEFEKQNPNIKVKLIHIPDNYFQKLHLLVASNLSPDVIFLNNLNSKLYIDANKLEPLNRYIKNSKIININDYFENSLNPISDNDYIYAIPRDISNLVIYYNKDIFDKYNVEYPTKNWTLNDFLNVSKQLTKDTNNDGKTDIFGFGFEKNPLFWLPFLWSTGGGILSNDGKIILDSKNSKDALQFYTDLRNKYHVAQNIDEQSSLTVSQMFLQGKVAMHICGRWCSLTYKNNADFSWDIINFPNGQNGSIVDLDTSGWAISKTSQNKELAWKFIEFLSSDKSLELMAKDGLILPAKKSIANSNVFLNPPPDNARIFIDATQNAISTPNNKKYSEIIDLINENFESLFNGKKSVDDTINKDFINKLKKLQD